MYSSIDWQLLEDKRRRSLAYDDNDYSGGLKSCGQAEQAPTQPNYTNTYGQELSPESVIEKIFTYQPPTPTTLPKFQAVREAGKYFAKVVAQNVPGGQDRLNAVLKIREAVMLANAGISLEGFNF